WAQDVVDAYIHAAAVNAFGRRRRGQRQQQWRGVLWQPARRGQQLCEHHRQHAVGAYGVRQQWRRDRACKHEQSRRVVRADAHAAVGGVCGVRGAGAVLLHAGVHGASADDYVAAKVCDGVFAGQPVDDFGDCAAAGPARAHAAHGVARAAGVYADVFRVGVFHAVFLGDCALVSRHAVLCHHPDCCARVVRRLVLSRRSGGAPVDNDESGWRGAYSSSIL
ncbi:hypothetical protein IWW47_003633, partial [Coemansia sp. RSA 2052]